MKTHSEDGPINIDVGEDLRIKKLAEMIKTITGYKGKIDFDTSKPDGTPRKLMDVSRPNHLRWKAKIELRQGITDVYKQKFLKQ